MLLSDRIDANTTTKLEKTLLEQAKQFESIALDFGSVPYISGAGLRTLRTLHKLMRSKGGTLVIRNKAQTDWMAHAERGALFFGKR